MQARWEKALNKANDEKDKIRNEARSTGGGPAYRTEPSMSRPVTTVRPSPPSAMDAPTTTYGIPRR